jgi:hypothetical protein
VIHPGTRFTTQPDHDLQARQHGQQYPETATDAALETISVHRPAQGLSTDDEPEHTDWRTRVAPNMNRAIGR